LHFRGEFFLRPTLLISKSTYVSSNKISNLEIAHFNFEYPIPVRPQCLSEHPPVFGDLGMFTKMALFTAP